MDIFGEVLDQIELGTVLYAKLFVGGLFADGELGVTAEVGKPRLAFEAFQLLLRSAQLVIDDGDALVDEAGGVLRYFVFVVVGVLIVNFNKFVYKIFTAFFIGILY